MPPLHTCPQCGKDSPNNPCNACNEPENKYKQELLEALNLLDEEACHSVQDTENGEAKKVQDAYNLLYTFITDRI